MYSTFQKLQHFLGQCLEGRCKIRREIGKQNLYESGKSYRLFDDGKPEQRAGLIHGTPGSLNEETCLR